MLAGEQVQLPWSPLLPQRWRCLVRRQKCWPSFCQNLLHTKGSIKRTVTKYCPRNVAMSWPANTAINVRMKVASDKTSGNTPENLYFIMTRFGVFGGAGSALKVDRRWSPRSGSMNIFSSHWICESMAPFVAKGSHIREWTTRVRLIQSSERGLIDGAAMTQYYEPETKWVAVNPNARLSHNLGYVHHCKQQLLERSSSCKHQILHMWATKTLPRGDTTTTDSGLQYTSSRLWAMLSL